MRRRSTGRCGTANPRPASSGLISPIARPIVEDPAREITPRASWVKPVTAAAFIGSALFTVSPAVAATFALSHTPGQTGSATAVARFTTGGYKIQLAVKHLPKLGPRQFYECVYVGSGGHELVSGGTFSTSNGTITIQSAANPKQFTQIQIRREGSGVGV